MASQAYVHPMVGVRNTHNLTSINLRSIKILISSLLISLLISNNLAAEGTPELAPNMAISIMGQTGSSNPFTMHTSNDVAALNIGNTEYNYFAYRGKTTNEAKLNIYVKDPTSESIFIGLSSGTDNRLYGRAYMNYKFYVLDPSGNVVYESIVIDQSTAPIDQGTNIHADLNQGWVQTMDGAIQLGGTGYNAIEITSADLMSTGNMAEGDYSIEFEALDDNGNPIAGFGEGMEPDDYLIINFWDINVAQGTDAKKGRIWSKNWGLFAINDYGFPNRPFNGAFYVCAPDPSNTDLSYITKIDFNNAGYRPGGFNIAFNSFGTQMEDMASGLFFPETAKSVPNANVSIPEYDIYLNDPVERCLAAESASVLDLNGVSTCQAGSASYCISFITDKPGNVLLLLDFDGRDGKYTAGTSDRLIPFSVTDANLGSDICIDWDGRDGLGELVTGEIPLVLEFIQGRYNLPIYDAEYMENGFMIEAVRPAGPAPEVFYDDTDIPEDPGTGSPKDGTGGCAAPCHNWNIYVDDNVPGYGNLHTINTWWFSNRLVDELIAEFPVVLSCSIEGPFEICPNAEEEIMVVVSPIPDNGNLPAYTVEWNGPGVVSSADDNATVNAPGVYSATVSWTSNNGEMCFSECDFRIEGLEEAYAKDSILVAGQDFTYEGQTFTSDTIARFVYAGMAANGCDSIFDYCINFRPDVELFCSISGPDGICEGGFESITLSTSHEPASEPFPTINSVSWDGQIIISSTDSSAVVTGGSTYTVTIEYTDQNENNKVATCELFVDQYPNVQTKVDEVIPFGGEIEINGIIYDSTAVDTFFFQTVNGCDSTVVVCVTEEDPDIVLSCELSGPAGICMDETGIVTLTYDYTPVSAPEPIINSIEWTGNGIVSANADLTEATVTGGETYSVQINYTNPVNGETKDAFCDIFVDQFPTYEIQIDTIKESGETITINGVDYDSEGEFLQDGTTTEGCDSIVIIRIVEEATLLCYDLNDCKSVDYTRFTPKVAEDFDCAHVSGSYLYRENPQVNGHSCTEGVNGTDAICISSVEDCNYNAGDEKSAIIDVVIVPEEGNAVRVSGLDFYERAPERYQWNVGFEGVNNYPTLYGVRVLKNGTEIFRSEGNATNLDWTLQKFSFISNDEFIIDIPTILRFELLAYCTVGNDSDVTAWDLDEIKIKANCTSPETGTIDVTGQITNVFGDALENVELHLSSDHSDHNGELALTDTNGYYAFDNLTADHDYKVIPELDRNHLKGVTTADLIHIQRHILGLEYFETPYQYIAADADRSNSISAVDLLEIRKLILGINDAFTNNTSYRFGASSQELAVDNPWIIDDSVVLQNIEEDRHNQNFTAIKVGDVSSLRNINGSNPINKRSSKSVLLKAEDVYLKTGESSVVTFEFDTADEIQGFQMAIDISGFAQLKPIGDSDNLDYVIDGDIMRIIWSKYASSTDLKSMTFELVSYSDGHISEMFRLNDKEMSPEVYTTYDMETEEIELAFSSGTLTTVLEPTAYPNPFDNVLYIDNPIEENLKVELVDVSGRMLYRNVFGNDNPRVEINKSEIGNYKGLMIIRLQYGDQIKIQRVISM